MSPKRSSGSSAADQPPVERQVSSGGVVYRRGAAGVQIALIQAGDRRRWQLPKGIVDPGESPEQTAVREVREEAGVDAELVAPLETIEYWYQARRGATPVRYHKFVHFFLLRYLAGEVSDHDHEVHEARWVRLEDVEGMLAFPNERKVVAAARTLLAES